MTPSAHERQHEQLARLRRARRRIGPAAIDPADVSVDDLLDRMRRAMDREAEAFRESFRRSPADATLDQIIWGARCLVRDREWTGMSDR